MILRRSTNRNPIQTLISAKLIHSYRISGASNVATYALWMFRNPLQSVGFSLIRDRIRSSDGSASTRGRRLLARLFLH